MASMLQDRVVGDLRHRVFVYGTLQRGGVYHRLIARWPRLGVVRTPPRYTLVDLGWYPGLLEGGRTSVRGEVYSVDASTLKTLDRLEEHPRVYVRQTIPLQSWPDVQVYILRLEHAAGAPVLARGVWPPAR